MPETPRIIFEENSIRDRTQEEKVQEKEADPVLFLKRLKENTEVVQKTKGPQLKIKL
jgi:hypothetical protein